jgi:hypothetical protein
MLITRVKIQYLPTTVLILMGVFLCVLTSTGVAAAFDFHADSAHGNPTYGVNRSGTGYDIGACTHCHDTFDDSICGQYNFMLFFDEFVSPCQVGCMSCHSYFATWQPTLNYPYAKTFGGSPQIWYGDIYTQFCNANSLPAVCGSRHHLGQIRAGLVSPVGQEWGFNDDPNPCVACHPPHHAQQNHPVAIDGEGKLNTAIRRPSHYKSTDPKDFLWGDDDNRPGEPERMDEYALSVGGYYQAPYYTSGTKYEPSGNVSPSDGSDLPDYVTFCMDCHQYPNWDPEIGVSVKAIKWGPPWCTAEEADIHGAAPANTVDTVDMGCGQTESSLRPPYDTYEPNQSNYVLSCLDCHEPHGTYKRLHLIRLRINGEAVGVDSSPCDQSNDYANICDRCHNLDHGGNCFGCHGNFEGFHGSRFECAQSIEGCDSLHPENCPHSF